MRQPGVIELESVERTHAAGAALAVALASEVSDEPWLIGLAGELGAGKTSFVSGFLCALGHDGPVRSPTYTFVEPYRLAGRDVMHCDLYRLDNPRALEDLGLRDLMTSRAVVLIEWPERAAARLGPWDLIVRLQYREPGGDGRLLSFEPHSARGSALVRGVSTTPDKRPVSS